MKDTKMKKHKLIEMIENEVKDGTRIFIEYDNDMFTKEIKISQAKNKQGENIAVLSAYEYEENSELYTDE